MTRKTQSLKRAVAYIRVSTTEQAVDGVSIDAQLERARAWARANGYDLVEAYSDKGLSGKNTKRPGLQDALNDVCVNGGALVVYSLSRLARSVRDTLEIAERLEKSEADLVSLTEQIDTTSALGRMFFRLTAVLAEFERELTIERTVSALAYKKSQGERVGSIPYGFEVGADGVRLVPNKGEQETARIIRLMKDNGRSLRGIVKDLTDQGIPPRGEKWHMATVQRILAR